MNNQSAYSPSFQAEVSARFDALEGHIVRVGAGLESIATRLDEMIAGMERESSALGEFCAGVGEIGEFDEAHRGTARRHGRGACGDGTVTCGLIVELEARVIHRELRELECQALSF